DSPPCVGLSDVQIIGTVADSVLMVVSMESTTEESLKASVRQLRQAGAPLIGVAVNKVTKKGANGTPFYFVDYTDALPQRTA
ncbi:MAG TPA: hypothetical protein VG944_03250, partial [Fimbriimonas sp.]|nr:hypothetical protein [Fimbriimonas sp.]